MKKLLDYSCVLNPKVNDLLDCYDQWNASDRNSRDEFSRNREKFVKRCSGISYDDSVILSTSGSSTGLAKKYRWGPNFGDYLLFHYRICFNEFAHDGHVNLKYNEKRNESVICGSMTRYGDTKMLVVGAGKDTELNRDRVMKIIANSFKKPIISFIPTQLEIMIKKKSILLDSLLQHYPVFHCTGEICSPGVKSFMSYKKVSLLDTMRVWNGGASFHTCRHGGLHWNNMSSKTELKNGSLISSDYWNCAQLFWNAETGDRLKIIEEGKCSCGLQRQYNEWTDRVYMLNTPKGYFDYTMLKNTFLKTIAEHKEMDIFDVDNSLLGVNFGANEERLAVFCEFKEPIDLNFPQINQLSNLTGLETTFEGGLKYGMFKNQRIFRL